MNAPKKSKRPKLDANELNIGLALRNEPDLHSGKLFRLDTFSGRTLLMHPIPVGGIEHPDPWSIRDTTDVHVTHLMMWLQYHNFQKVSAARVSRAVDVEADRNQFSSALEMLDRLPVWDGVPRLDKFFISICGASAEADGADEDEIFQRARYLHAVGRCFFIGLVRRIKEPGCKNDTMVVLESPQGRLKSTLLRAIAFDQDEWFSDSMPPNLADKDARQHLPGKLIIEMSEMSQMGRTKIESFKQFLSGQTDKYRPSYGRREVIHKRQCIFVGTTNSTAYLPDETGNRRFWPIQCGAIDIDMARDSMPQLYAEALEAYYDNEDHWLPKDIEIAAEVEQRQRMTDDPWEGKIKRWINERKRQMELRDCPTLQTSVAEVLEKALDITSAQDLDKPAQTRVGVILSKLGGERKRIMISGERDWYVIFKVGQCGTSGAPKLRVVSND